jgi:hypothetical protein
MELIFLAVVCGFLLYIVAMVAFGLGMVAVGLVLGLLGLVTSAVRWLFLGLETSPASASILPVMETSWAPPPPVWAPAPTFPTASKAGKKSKKSKKQKHLVSAASTFANAKPRLEPPRKAQWVRYLKGSLSPVRGRFHLDQCASDGELARMLRDQGFEVSVASELGMHKTSDPDQLRYATDRRSIVITFDVADFQKLHGVQQHAGMLLSVQRKEAYLEITRKAVLIAQGKL